MLYYKRTHATVFFVKKKSNTVYEAHQQLIISTCLSGEIVEEETKKN